MSDRNQHVGKVFFPAVFLGFIVLNSSAEWDFQLLYWPDLIHPKTEKVSIWLLEDGILLFPLWALQGNNSLAQCCSPNPLLDRNNLPTALVWMPFWNTWNVVFASNWVAAVFQLVNYWFKARGYFQYSGCIQSCTLELLLSDDVNAAMTNVVHGSERRSQRKQSERRSPFPLLGFSVQYEFSKLRSWKRWRES